MNKDWENAEQEVCKLYGGELVPRSGAGKVDKMDVEIFSVASPLYGWRVEVKQRSKSFTISEAVTTKYNKQAALGGYKYFIRTDVNGEKWVHMKEKWFKDLID